MLSYYQHPSVTIQNLKKARTLLTDPSRWHQGGLTSGKAYDMVGACYAVGVPNIPQPAQDKTPDGIVRPDIARGTLPEEVWFLRQAIIHLDPYGDGTISRWNDEPARQHEDMLDAFDYAIAFAEADRADQERDSGSQRTSTRSRRGPPLSGDEAQLFFWEMERLRKKKPLRAENELPAPFIKRPVTE